MCLAEALLRIPDAATRDALIRDKLAPGDWRAHVGQSPSLFVNAATWGLVLTGKLVATTSEQSLSRRADAAHRPLRRADHPRRRRRRHAADGRAVRHRPHDRGGARARAASARRAASRSPTTCWARRRRRPRTPRATTPITSTPSTRSARRRAGRGIYEGPGISIKLSALHPRYQRIKRARVMAELLPRVKALAALARSYDIGFNIDAEEADRLDTLARSAGGAVSRPRACRLERARLRHPGLRQALPGGDRLVDRPWAPRQAAADGAARQGRLLGQRDQARAARRARRFPGLHAQGPHRRLLSRLRAANCSPRRTRSIRNSPRTTPQTLASVLVFAGPNYYRGQYEFQCLHGMGEPLYEEVVGRDKLDRPCRVYAPVGSHETLLAYLVRRLLENGANTSFVNRIADETSRSPR